MSEEVIRCDSLPKIHTAFCRTPLNCDALTLADSVVLGRWVAQRRRKRALIATEYTRARAEIMGKSLQLLIVTVLIHSSGTQIRCTISRRFFLSIVQVSKHFTQSNKEDSWQRGTSLPHISVESVNVSVHLIPLFIPETCLVH